MLARRRRPSVRSLSRCAGSVGAVSRRADGAWMHRQGSLHVTPARAPRSSHPLAASLCGDPHACGAPQVLDTKELEDDELFDALRMEIQILKQLKHPYIVNLHEVVRDSERVYIIQECLGGGELFEQLLAKGPFKEDYALAIFAQVAIAVDYMHGLDVVHRDLKVSDARFARRAPSSRPLACAPETGRSTCACVSHRTGARTPCARTPPCVCGVAPSDPIWPCLPYRRPRIWSSRPRARRSSSSSTSVARRAGQLKTVSPVSWALLRWARARSVGLPAERPPPGNAPTAELRGRRCLAVRGTGGRDGLRRESADGRAVRQGMRPMVDGRAPLCDALKDHAVSSKGGRPAPQAGRPRQGAPPATQRSSATVDERGSELPPPARAPGARRTFIGAMPRAASHLPRLRPHPLPPVFYCTRCAVCVQARGALAAHLSRGKGSDHLAADQGSIEAADHWTGDQSASARDVRRRRGSSRASCPSPPLLARAPAMAWSCLISAASRPHLGRISAPQVKAHPWAADAIKRCAENMPKPEEDKAAAKPKVPAAERPTLHPFHHSDAPLARSPSEGGPHPPRPPTPVPAMPPTSQASIFKPMLNRIASGANHAMGQKIKIEGKPKNKGVSREQQYWYAMEISPPSDMRQQAGVKLGADGKFQMDNVPEEMRKMLEEIERAKSAKEGASVAAIKVAASAPPPPSGPPPPTMGPPPPPGGGGAPPPPSGPPPETVEAQMQRLTTENEAKLATRSSETMDTLLLMSAKDSVRAHSCQRAPATHTQRRANIADTSRSTRPGGALPERQGRRARLA